MKRFLWSFIFVLICVLASGYFLFNEYALHKKIQNTREKLVLIVSSAVVSIDADLLLEIPLRMDGDKTEAYKIIFNKLVRIKEANPLVKYIYILTATDQAGVMQFVIDANPLPEITTARSVTSFSGDTYDVRHIPEILDAYKKPIAGTKLVTDAWGTTLSGYAPILNGRGKVIGILCVDADGTQIKVLQHAGRARFLFAALTGFLTLVVLMLSLKKNVAR